MGDDPYDFDIAIPSGGGGGGGGKRGGTKGNGWSGAPSSGASDSDSDGNLSQSSDSDDANYRRKTAKKKPTADARRGGASTAVAPKGGGGGGGGSNALDKAKNFLSKYSTKATPGAKAVSTSGRSKRLEMSLDDEDFSLDSSGESITRPATTRTATATQAATKATAQVAVRAFAAESDHDSDRSDDHSPRSLSEDDASASGVDVTPLGATHAPTTVRTMETASRDSEEDDDDEEDDARRPQPTQATTVTTAPGSVPATWSSSFARKASVSDQEEEEEEEEEVESIASQSDAVDDSVDAQRSPPTTGPTSVVPARTTAIASSAVSESGVYEDDDFEEASVHAPQHPAKPTPVAVTTASTVALTEDESHVHYSLDFADDVDVPTTSDTARHNERDDDARSNASSSAASDRHQDSYADDASDDDQDVGRETNRTEVVQRDEDRRSTAAAFETSTMAHDLSEAYSQDDGGFEAESAGTLLTPIVKAGNSDSTVRQEPAPIMMSLPSAAMQHAPPSHQSVPSRLPPHECVEPERSRPRVAIVREYEQQRACVEKKDASTQFTGNHASIQTDLTPNGMRTSAERRQSREPPTDTAYDGATLDRQSGRPFLPAAPTMPNEMRPPEHSPLPPPPPSRHANYGLYDPLQLPMHTSMSLYKQQLLTLQQQIHQKKLETERLFRDRISSRYTSMRGTERFLETNRPPRIPLWEALVRVDPSLDEARAKEIARMASSDGVA